MYRTRIISYKYVDEDVENAGVGWFVIPSQNVHEDTEEIHEGPQLRLFHPEIQNMTHRTGSSAENLPSAYR